MSAEDRRWRAEDDMRALMRAEEIKRDKERLNAVQQHAEAVQRAAAMPKITVKTSGRGAK